MRFVQVPLGDRQYSICVGKNIWTSLAGFWPGRLEGGKVLLVSDENVFALYGEKTMAVLREAGLTVALVVVPAGESSKTLAWAETLYTAAIEAGLDRGGAVSALGGGVVGDLAGFAAATYLRGVPFVQMPTTLLAQVDSSVGGKTAVNHPKGKNLIGAFHQPRLVWIELDTLTTLPQREFLAGAAEVVKYGIILSEPFLAYLEENWHSFMTKDAGVMSEIISRCCELKAKVVVADEREKGERAILNFGHTLGHALEAATSYEYYLHGEAVLAGMVMAVHLGVKTGRLDKDQARRVLILLAKIGLLPPPPGLCLQDILRSLSYDKKRVGEKTVFILPHKIGSAGIFSDVDSKFVSQVVSRYLNQDTEGSLLSHAD